MSNITPEHLRRKVTLECGPSMTEQAHADQVNIHSIMKKYKETGMVDHMAAHSGDYADMVGAPDYLEAQNIIAEANSLFASIPSYIRDDFGNDPAQFLDFLQDPANKQQMDAYGFPTDHLPDVSPDPTPTPTQGDKTPPPDAEEA